MLIPSRHSVSRFRHRIEALPHAEAVEALRTITANATEAGRNGPVRILQGEWKGRTVTVVLDHGLIVTCY